MGDWDEVQDGIQESAMRAFSPSFSIVYHSVALGYDQEIDSIFDAAGERIGLADGIEQILTRPEIKLRAADLEEPPAAGDSITIDTTTFDVKEVLPDGGGGYALILHEGE